MDTDSATDQLLAGRYRMGRLLGQGAMANVYEAVDERLERPVAVKRLKVGVSEEPEARDRFRIEAQAAAGLAHSNVVAVFDTGEDEDGQPFLVMELLPGRTLADRLVEGAIPEPEALRFAGDILSAMAAAEAAGVLHRDIKPANILLTAEGCAKVADFGIAKVAEAGSDLTSTGLLLGTPAYLAPERLEGKVASARSDIYSLGVILYEALSGRRAFPGESPAAVAASISSVGVPRLGPDEASESTRDAVAAATAIRPQLRFASAEVMATALGVGLGSVALSAPDADATTVMAVSPPRGSNERRAPAVLALLPGVVTARWDRLASRLGVDGRKLAAAVGAAALVSILFVASLGGGGGSESPTPKTSVPAVPAVQAETPTTPAPPATEAPDKKGKGRKGPPD